MSMWPFSRPSVHFEQAVYGSFPFWHRGYDLLGRSPGCLPDWGSGLKATCQQLGERLRETAGPGGFLARWLHDGTWMVVRPFSPGTDDVGRPDAAAFHAIFLDPDSARTVAYDPFRLASAFRDDFGPESSQLQPGTIPLPKPDRGPGPDDALAEAIADAIIHGRRALIESSGPIDPLAQQVWNRLARRHRHRRSLATWAYTDAGVFDLIGLPRLTGIDPSDQRLFVVPADPSPPTGPPPVAPILGGERPS